MNNQSRESTSGEMMTEKKKTCCCFEEEACIKWSYNYQNLLGGLTIPCLAAGFWWYCYVTRNVEQTPEDARKIKRLEQNRMLEQMEGRWNVEVVSGQPTGPNIMCLCDKGEFTHATIQGNTLTMLYGTWKGDPNGDRLPRKSRITQVSKIELSRTEDGRLFTDQFGTEITRFDPDAGLIAFEDRFGKCWNLTWVAALCDQCVQDISEGHKCNECEDFVLCTSCFSEHGHSHLMTFKRFSREPAPITSQPGGSKEPPPYVEPTGGDGLKSFLATGS